MKIKVNADYASPTTEELIAKKLKAYELPTCFGNMSPPIVESLLEVEVEEIFKKKESIPEENIVLLDVSELVSDIRWQNLLIGRVLDKNGEIQLKHYKEVASTAYVDHLAKCAKCSYTALCDKLTYHYLTTVKLLQNKRRG